MKIRRNERRLVVAEGNNSPGALGANVLDRLRLSVPEQEVLRLIGEKSRRNGTDKLSSARVDRIIRAARNRRG